MVTTPVPPMPVTSTLQGSSNAGNCGSGSAAEKSSPPFGAGRPFFSAPPSTVTKLGQKPFTQE